MYSRRKSTTIRQLELLVDFANRNRNFALGKLRSKEGRVVSTRLWRKCAELLNQEGPTRLPREWAKVWNDMKSRVRSKLNSLMMSQHATGDGPPNNVTLSPLEERVADIIGRDVGPIPEVTQDPLAEEASPEESEAADEVLMDDDKQHVVSRKDIEDLKLGVTRSLPPLAPLFPPNGLRQTIKQESHMRLSTPRDLKRTQPSRRQEDEESSLASEESAPRRRRSRERPRGGWRGQRRSAVRTSVQSRVALRARVQGQTGRRDIEESLVRIEWMRARTDIALAQARLRQAEAGKAQAEAALMAAEASRVWARAMQTFSEAFCSLVPALNEFLTGSRVPRTQRVQSEEEE